MILSAKFLHNEVSVNRNNSVLIRMNSPTGANNPDRRPIVLGLSIDRSWSMKGEKLEAVIQAASSLVNWLTRRDFLSVVAYAEDIHVIQPVIQLVEKTSIINRIHTISPGTSTNLSGGWLHTLRGLELFPETSVYKRAILLTDGNPTQGITDPIDLIQIAGDHYKKGISTTVVGFGDDFNEILLKDIADAGGGNFYYVESPEGTGDIFFREFGNIGSLYAQSIETKVVFGKDVEFLELISDIPFYTETDPEQPSRIRSVVIQCGDMRADDIRNIVIRVKTHPENLIYNGENETGIKITNSFYNLADKMKLENAEFDLKPDWKSVSVKEDADVIVETIVAKSGKTLKRASSLIREGSFEEASQTLNSLIKDVDQRIDLAPEVMSSLKSRLEALESKVKENSKTAGKHLMAGASDIRHRNTDPISDNVVYHDRIFVYKSTDDIDLYRCPELKSNIQEKMYEGFRFVVINLKSSSFIDSSAIGTLIQISGWLKRRGGELVVSDLSDSVKKVFSITRLESHIRVAETEEAARVIINDVIQERNI
ncbi:von Willebrand factor type A domain protein [Leptospira weilii serovar Ranarum str. ICFT]|uniref:Anti-sigma factor antagonist n=1 Tax=Leptospira weilii serovar Ranarum str. ICFT TaxID=1218598 RepID=N1WAG3_9LEPT|nr:anti-sigma factor antagonist [Leptospira weilii]EMY77246.1 von Willebrand factor type A domain protein [Leptospira weilii serovar Ranarum str. ICFT]